MSLQKDFISKKPAALHLNFLRQNPQLRKRILLVFLLVFIGLFFTQKIFFITADLGRHIRNGEFFLKEGFSISKNFYSYTEPNFPVVNHHWGAGVILFFLWKHFGFEGLTILNILIYLSTFLFFFKIAERQSSFGYAFFFSILSIPLFTSRTEIRPEGFSFLFMGLYYYLLYLFRENKISFKSLFIFVPLQLLWVNLHLFFIMGPFLIGIFWFESLINKGYRGLIKQYTILGIITLAVSFINPFALKGFLEPFMIMREYGYMLAENQSVIFMQRRFPDNPLYYHFEALFLLAIASFILVFLNKRRKEFIPRFLILLFFSALSWMMIRGIPLFGFFFIPVVSANVFEIMKDYPYKPKDLIHHPAIIIPIIAILIIFYLAKLHQSPLKKLKGFGLYPKVNLSAEFFKSNNIQGPIFNNYDIGSYLIYHLFPKRKVFVDNRPEAYSVSFFKEIYEPMQADEGKWAEIDEKYNFNCIYFYRHDITPHAQPFLIERIKDPKWAPVFVDSYTLILLKRNKRNEEIIRRYELPQSIFVMQ